MDVESAATGRTRAQHSWTLWRGLCWCSLATFRFVSGCFPTASPTMFYHGDLGRLSVGGSAIVEEPGVEQTYSTGYSQRTPRAKVIDSHVRFQPKPEAGFSVGGCLGLNCGFQLELGQRLLRGTEHVLPLNVFAFGGTRQGGLGLAGGAELAHERLFLELNIVGAYARESHDTVAVYETGEVRAPVDFPIASIGRSVFRAELPIALRVRVGRVHLMLGMSSYLSGPAGSGNVSYRADPVGSPLGDTELASPTLERVTTPWRAWTSGLVAWE